MYAWGVHDRRVGPVVVVLHRDIARLPAGPEVVAEHDATQLGLVEAHVEGDDLAGAHPVVSLAGREPEWSRPSCGRPARRCRCRRRATAAASRPPRAGCARPSRRRRQTAGRSSRSGRPARTSRRAEAGRAARARWRPCRGPAGRPARHPRRRAAAWCRCRRPDGRHPDSDTVTPRSSWRATLAPSTGTPAHLHPQCGHPAHPARRHAVRRTSTSQPIIYDNNTENHLFQHADFTYGSCMVLAIASSGSCCCNSDLLVGGPRAETGRSAACWCSLAGRLRGWPRSAARRWQCRVPFFRYGSLSEESIHETTDHTVQAPCRRDLGARYRVAHPACWCDRRSSRRDPHEARCNPRFRLLDRAQRHGGAVRHGHRRGPGHLRYARDRPR